MNSFQAIVQVKKRTVMWQNRRSMGAKLKLTIRKSNWSWNITKGQKLDSLRGTRWMVQTLDSKGLKWAVFSDDIQVAKLKCYLHFAHDRSLWCMILNFSLIIYQYQHLARAYFWLSIFQDEKDKPKITKKQNYIVFRHKPKEKSKSKSKDEKERIQIESESSDEETQSFLHRSTKESSFLNRFLKTSENLEDKGPVLYR